MKIALFLIAILIQMGQLFGQPFTTAPLPKAETIPLFRIGISDIKTSNLIFPYDIKSIDRGSKELLVQKAKGSENILQIKAASQSFRETNLSVVTVDKKLYSFLLNYDSVTQQLNYRFTDSVFDSMSAINNAHSIVEKPQLNEAEIQNYAVMAASKKATIRRIEDKSFGIKMRLNNVFIKKNVLFFSLQLQNSTPINYDVESLHFLIKDMAKGKRTAVQELLKSPVYIHGNASFIEGNKKQRIIVAIPKFTIPDKKVFVIQLREADGGRHLGVYINNKHLIQAKPL